MDQCRWSRADEHETGHKVPSFVEVDRRQTPSRSPGMQVEMGHPETNSWDFWPTGSSKSNPRPWGGRLTKCRATSLREKTWACLHVHFTIFISICSSPLCGWVPFPFPSVVCGSLLPFFCHFLSNYGSFISSCSNRSWTFSFTWRPYVATSSTPTTGTILWSKTWSTSGTSTPESTGDCGSPRGSSTYDQGPQWCHASNNMWGHTIPELDGGTSLVHLQCTSQYSSPWILHSVQPSLLHQPAHLVHVGSLPASILHGHPMAGWNRRYIRLSKRTSTCWPSTWLSTSLARRSRLWPVFSDWYPPI